jgi:hypothetical protein
VAYRDACCAPSESADPEAPVESAGSDGGFAGASWTPPDDPPLPPPLLYEIPPVHGLPLLLLAPPFPAPGASANLDSLEVQAFFVACPKRPRMTTSPAPMMATSAAYSAKAWPRRLRRDRLALVSTRRLRLRVPH